MSHKTRLMQVQLHVKIIFNYLHYFIKRIIYYMHNFVNTIWPWIKVFQVYVNVNIVFITSRFP
jgi:hypothetical protein